MFQTVKRYRGLAVLAVASFAIAGFAVAAESEAELNRQLDATAATLTQELNQTNQEMREADRLGTADTVPNKYGSLTDTERVIDNTVREANDELARAQHNLDYQTKRQEIETNRSLYYPGSNDYQRLTDQIRQLDDDYQNGRFTTNWNP
ncbi:MAG: hypothetical protein LIP77_07140 [Planctomycetes bacterium]|nr:hypothetical protein [Planctomycetota bacterium]